MPLQKNSDKVGSIVKAAVERLAQSGAMPSPSGLPGAIAAKPPEIAQMEKLSIQSWDRLSVVDTDSANEEGYVRGEIKVSGRLYYPQDLDDWYGGQFKGRVGDFVRENFSEGSPPKSVEAVLPALQRGRIFVEPPKVVLGDVKAMPISGEDGWYDVSFTVAYEGMLQPGY